MSHLFTKLKQSLIFAFFLLLPLQLNKFFWFDFSLIQGVRVDYLAATVYLTDLIVLLLFLFQMPEILGKAVKSKRSLVLITLAGIYIIASVQKEITILNIIKLLEVYVVYYFFRTNKFDHNKLFYFPLAISTVIVVIIATIQVLKSSSIGGLFYFLGERSFNISTPGIALFDVGNKFLLRAYSVFSHPNALAGYLGVMFLVFKNWKTNLKIHKIALLLLIAIGIIITFSKAVILSLIAIVLFSQMKYIKNTTFALILIVQFLIFFLSFAIPETGFEFIDQRIELNKAGMNIFINNPLFGTAGKGYLKLLPEFIQFKYFFVQPIHNLVGLLLVEWGIVGLMLFINWFGHTLRKSSAQFKFILLFILLTSVVDHYWINSQQNLLLVSALAGMFTNSLGEDSGKITYE